MNSIEKKLWGAALFASMMGVTGMASAGAPLSQGEIVTYLKQSGVWGPGLNPTLLRIVPGAVAPLAPEDSQAIVTDEPSDYGNYYRGMSIAIASKRTVFATGWQGKIKEIDVTSETTSVFASGGFLDYPYGIAIEANGDLIVYDLPPFGSPELIRIDRVTKAQMIVAQGGHLNDHAATSKIAIGADGGIYFTKAAENTLVRVDPITGAQEVVVSGDPLFATAADLERSRKFPNEIVSVTGPSGAGPDWIRVERTDITASPATRQVVTSSQDINFLDTVDIALEWDDSVVAVTDNTGNILRIDPQGNVEPIELLVQPSWPVGVEVMQPECGDGIDNDLDGMVDIADTFCVSALDRNESPECSDGVDNDGDGLTDFGQDPQCLTPETDKEASGCANSISPISGPSTPFVLTLTLVGLWASRRRSEQLAL